MCVFAVCTYNGEDEEARGDRRGAIEHDADVVTCQFHVIRCVGDQNWGQQEANGRSQLGKRSTEAQRETDLETLLLLFHVLLC